MDNFRSCGGIHEGAIGRMLVIRDRGLHGSLVMNLLITFGGKYFYFGPVTKVAFKTVGGGWVVSPLRYGIDHGFENNRMG